MGKIIKHYCPSCIAVTEQKKNVCQICGHKRKRDYSFSFKNMKSLLYISLILLVVSCSPKMRFTRLVEKFPHLLTSDTITVHDTVRVEVPKVVHDTIINEHFFHEITRDTLVLQKERLTVKIFHDTIKKNVFIKGECDTVTVEKIVERKIPIKYYEKTPTWRKILNQVLLWSLILILLYGIYRLIKFLLTKKKV